jgi:cell division protein FtsW
MTAATTRLTPASALARRQRARAASKLPWIERPLATYHLLLMITGALLVLGLLMVLSASSVSSLSDGGSSYSVFTKQLMWLTLGLPVAWVASRLPVKVLRMLAYPLLLLAVAGLLAVLVPGVGASRYGATRWIDVGPIELQPSEPAKLALALWGAHLLVSKEKLLGDWRHLLVPLIPVAAFFGLLVMLEPDLGTTIAMTLSIVALLFVVGMPLRWFGAVVSVLVAAAGVLAVTAPYRFARLTSAYDPSSDSQGTGYQASHGLQALASGGWWGRGLGASHEKWSYLPNAHTDYVFAIIGEELGLVGTLVVLGLFGALAWTGLRIATHTTDPFIRLASAAITTWLVGQAIINMGYVCGLLPVTGIPLPLISAGGTSLVLTLMAVGILLSFARAEPAAAEALALRGRRWWPRVRGGR